MAMGEDYELFRPGWGISPLPTPSFLLGIPSRIKSRNEESLWIQSLFTSANCRGKAARVLIVTSSIQPYGWPVPTPWELHLLALP